MTWSKPLGVAALISLFWTAAAPAFGAESAATLTPASNHFAKGYDLLKDGDPDSAVAEFKAGLKIQPNNAMAWFYLGQARFRLGSTELAKAAFEKSLVLDPNGKLSDRAAQELLTLNGSTHTTTSSAKYAPLPAAQPNGMGARPGLWESRTVKSTTDGKDQLGFMAVAKASPGYQEAAKQRGILRTAAGERLCVSQAMVSGNWPIAWSDRDDILKISNGKGCDALTVNTNGSETNYNYLCDDKALTGTMSFRGTATSGGASIAIHDNLEIRFSNGSTQVQESESEYRFVADDCGGLPPYDVANRRYVTQLIAQRNQQLAQANAAYQEQTAGYQRNEACNAQCKSTHDSCESAANAQGNHAIVSGLLGAITGQGNAVDSTQAAMAADDAHGSCSDAWATCLSMCK